MTKILCNSRSDPASSNAIVDPAHSPTRHAEADFAAFKSRERKIRAKSRNAKDAKREKRGESFLWIQCDPNAFRAFRRALSLKSLYI